MLKLYRWLNNYFLKKLYIKSLVKRGLCLGKGASIQKDVHIDSLFCHLISIGDDCTLAPRVMILAHDASMKRLIGYTRVSKVTIGKLVFIGAGTIILPGVTIGDNVVIGAGSVVSKDIPSDTVVAGNPAKIIGKTQLFKEKHRGFLKTNVDNYIL